MKATNNYKQDYYTFGHTSKSILLMLGILLIMFWMGSAAVYAQKNVPKISTSTTGSGKMFKTTVDRHTKGELSDEDNHQISTLGSHIIRHLNTAVKDIEHGFQKSPKRYKKSTYSGRDYSQDASGYHCDNHC